MPAHPLDPDLLREALKAVASTNGKVAAAAKH